MVKLIANGKGANGKRLYVRIPHEVVSAAGLTQGNEMLVNFDRLSGKIVLEKIAEKQP